jgi:hypothetical protein
MVLQAPEPLEPHHSTFVVGDGAGMVALDGTPFPHGNPRPKLPARQPLLLLLGI